MIVTEQELQRAISKSAIAFRMKRRSRQRWKPTGLRWKREGGIIPAMQGECGSGTGGSPLAQGK